jgi:ABC-type bacteriocin/lantibiotic exporter with double-glycine peptidase domain
MIVKAVEQLMQGRTTFIITHRVSTLTNCDMLLEIENGRLVDVTSNVPTTVRGVLAVGGRDAALRGSKADA